MRRNFRPFFVDPKTGAALPSKKLYDVVSWLTTQLTFSFAVAPFLILSFSESWTAWSRVYFYAIVGTAALIAFFASPATAYLKKEIARRNANAGVDPNGTAGHGGDVMIHRSASSDSLVNEVPVMGISQDLEKEFENAVREIREFEARKKK